ncbi:hypothetical protein [Paenibacillus sp. V4I7]|uniref:hypothetical protein n=1 Tax=Paenibacillus sp. V4I7 TaxID=3042307 RepID=UPI0035938C75
MDESPRLHNGTTIVPVRFVRLTLICISKIKGYPRWCPFKMRFAGLSGLKSLLENKIIIAVR